MGFRNFTLILLVISLLLIQNSFAEEKVGFVKRKWRSFLGIFKREEIKEKPAPQVKSKPEPERAPLEELTEKELRDRIKHMLEITPEVADFIPELKVTLNEKAAVLKVEYNIDGVYTDIDKLSKDILIMIHKRINTERTRIQTERIQRQLEAARAAQSVPRTPLAPQPPPTPPRTLTPPKAPTPPPTPPSPPRR